MASLETLANCVDQDQTPQNEMSDHGIHTTVKPVSVATSIKQATCLKGQGNTEW